jgi:hypothetical protein
MRDGSLRYAASGMSEASEAEELVDTASCGEVLDELEREAIASSRTNTERRNYALICLCMLTSAMECFDARLQPGPGVEPPDHRVTSSSR